MFIENRRLSLVLIGMTCLAAITGICLVEPIAQDSSYHNFADSREILGVPNFFNVLSNLAFLLVGLVGVYQHAVKDRLTVVSGMRFIYLILFAGVAMVAIGSSYYHLYPDNRTLVWDRLPMTVAFMALFCIVVAEFVSESWGRLLFVPLAIAGAGSVMFWYVGEINGQGDLRIYVLVQFLPILLIPLMLLCFPSSFSKPSVYWLLLLTYVTAKLFEHFDSEVYSALGFISGHSIKHLLAAVGLWLLLRAYQNRVFVSTERTCSSVPAKEIE